MNIEDIKILYEDNHILVVVKPQNIPVQLDESKDEDFLTLLKRYIKEKYNKPGNVYLGLVHRLDRPTGGVMVFAKTSKAAARISESIKNGEFQKTYYTVTVGAPRQKKDVLKNYLKKNMEKNIVTVVPELTDGAKYAELSYEVLENLGAIALLKVNLVTGRSHQIRVQLKTIGNPVFGDVKYGGDTLMKGANLALWAGELVFPHPTTKDIMVFKVYPPEDREPWKKFNMEKYIGLMK